MPQFILACLFSLITQGVRLVLEAGDLCRALGKSGPREWNLDLWGTLITEWAMRPSVWLTVLSGAGLWMLLLEGLRRLRSAAAGRGNDLSRGTIAKRELEGV